MSANKLLHQNDLQGCYPNSWYASGVDELPAQAALQESIQCDVCIIGGGFTGLSCALTLAESGADVVLLEAHRMGWGASGRNGGQLGSGQRVEQDVLEQKYGADTANLLWQLAQQSKQHVRELICSHKIDCDYKPGIIHVDHKPAYSAATEEYVDKLRRHYNYEDIEFVDKLELRNRLGSERYYSGSVDSGAGHLHPLRFALGLAQAGLARGVRVYENTEVSDYKSEALKVTVNTERGTVKASKLMLACNGYLGALDSRVASRVMPINNYIIATEKLDGALAKSLIRDDMAVADSKFVVNYFRMSADNRLLFGGRESYGYQFPEDIPSFVKSAMTEVFPQLQNTRIDYGWGGTLAITMNRMPYLQQLEKNVFSSSGYSGHGVGMATLAGKLCADAINDDAANFNVMAGVSHRKFPGGVKMRSPLLKLGMLYYSLRDRW